MLNISPNRITDSFPRQEMGSFKVVESRKRSFRPLRITFFFALAIIVVLFLPWTQNIQSKGYVTSLVPGQKPQSIHSVIDGRIEEWYVREGEFVERGDTILHLSEVNFEFLDSNLVIRTREQLDAKSESIGTYEGKIRALQQQMKALQDARDLALQQAANDLRQNHIQLASDSIDLSAYRTNLQIATQQFDRIRELYDKGLKSLTEFEAAKWRLEQAEARVRVQENQLTQLYQKRDNLQLQLAAIEREYADQLAKTESEKFSAMSARLDAIAMTSKLRNTVANYTERNTMYYVTAPQSGMITRALQSGIGEIIPAGTDIVTIMPREYSLAVESYVRPNDLPLVRTDDKAAILFDGWPAIVISGWPESSTGTFEGRVVAIDQFISDNGLYRILIAPGEGKEWPDQLRVGSGARTYMLLRRVPIWYEVWRQLNGFPADFYRDNEPSVPLVKEKAPIKSVK